MKFKTPETEAEYRDGRLKSDVKALLYLVVGYATANWPDVTVEVTDVFYEQGEFGSKSATHETHRAIDVALRGATNGQCEELGEWVNQNVVLSSPGMKPVVYHNVRTGLHLHLQTSKTGRITIVRTNV